MICKNGVSTPKKEEPQYTVISNINMALTLPKGVDARKVATNKAFFSSTRDSLAMAVGVVEPGRVHVYTFRFKTRRRLQEQGLRRLRSWVQTLGVKFEYTVAFGCHDDAAKKFEKKLADPAQRKRIAEKFDFHFKRSVRRSVGLDVTTKAFAAEGVFHGPKKEKKEAVALRAANRSAANLTKSSSKTATKTAVASGSIIPQALSWIVVAAGCLHFGLQC